jgi:hypothetical protein
MYEDLPGCLHFSSDIDRIRYRRMSTNICWVFGRPMKTGMMLLRGVSEFRSLICSFFRILWMTFGITLFSGLSCDRKKDFYEGCS